MTKEMCIPLSDLREATNGFSLESRIGSGGYGDVYKGFYNERQVAVKVLRVNTEQGIADSDYINEVGNLMRAKHPNIVQLLGYSYETQSEFVEHNGKRDFSKHIYRALCFEYLEGESLDKYLSACVEKSLSPIWSKCYNIIKGICEALNFLHGCEQPIFHLDLKPANILLDGLMVPKVADFGLSRFANESCTDITKRIAGTERYMPPEYKTKGLFSNKNDVFSFGVVMVEIIAGYSGHPNYREMDDVALQQVHNDWNDRIKAASENQSEELNQVHTCIDIAMRCRKPDRDERPTIAEVIDILNKTETHAPKIQSADVPPCLIFDSSSTMSDVLKVLTDELENITNQNQYSSSVPGNSSNVQQVNDIRETISDVEEELIIGRTEEMEEIVATLCGSITPENKIIVLPIYGIGGIGKTTLAQLVFNDSGFAGYSRAWIYVSQNLDLKKIGNSIISQLSEESHLTDKQMINKKLRELFAGKKILIVLDDVWEMDPGKLKGLKAMLKPGVGSMVTTIVTTRDEAIASAICHTVKPYKLETLTNEICWKIIEQKAAIEDRVDKERLTCIGREIATKCGGVALAAQTLGFTLMKYKTSDYWESVRDNYIWNLSASECSSSTDHQVLASLLLSYTHMPRWLKLCFSYCAVFPKGHKIKKCDLIHQWIALGFTDPDSPLNTMQRCENYVTQLLGLSFLQYSETSSSDVWRDKATLTMHDLVHDLARKILAHQIDIGGNKCRYALLMDCKNSLKNSVTYPALIKTLHYRGCGEIELSDDWFSEAKGLHVLDLSECFLIHKLPGSIGQLKQLRFLTAPGIQDEMIPNFITELSHLNYLNIRSSRYISALPESIGAIKGLRHLDLSFCRGIHEVPKSFAELKQLVYLDLTHCFVDPYSCVDPHCCKDLSDALGGFTKLEYLNLSRGQTKENAHPRVMPEAFSKLGKLRYLELSFQSMAESEGQIGSLLGSISKLSSLEHLDLSWNTQISSIPESIGNLKHLHTFNLSLCDNLKILPDSMDQMVSLKILNVRGCIKLDVSMLRRLNIALLLPHFLVRVCSDKCSNISLLEPTNPHELTIDRLENVKSAKEAQSIKLIEKEKICKMKFQWTVAAERFVDDKEVLEKLVPPSSVSRLTIGGYRSAIFPDWLTDIGQYLPYLSKLNLSDFSNCNKLRLLGRLPNLAELGLHRMNSLEEWSTEYTSGEDSANALIVPKLWKLTIEQCSRLTIKPFISRALWDLNIIDCDDVTTSPEMIECLSSLKSLSLTLGDADYAELPRWLFRLASLQYLSITNLKLENLDGDTRKLTRLKSLCLIGCNNMTSLPEWLGELTCLSNLTIEHCEGIRSLPDSIQQPPSKLTSLRIRHCPALIKLCILEKSKMEACLFGEKKMEFIKESEDSIIWKETSDDSYLYGDTSEDSYDEDDEEEEEYDITTTSQVPYFSHLTAGTSLVERDTTPTLQLFPTEPTEIGPRNSRQPDTDIVDLEDAPIISKKMRTKLELWTWEQDQEATIFSEGNASSPPVSSVHINSPWM